MIRRGIFVLVALALAGCEELPTSAPLWEQTWAVPGEDIVVGVDEVVPAGVAVSPDRSAFEVGVPGTAISLSVAEMCSSCATLHGVVAPKPAYQHTFQTTTSLPSSLVSVHLTGGQLDVRMEHNMSFDPLRPSSNPADERGFVVIEVTSSGAVVARDSISGDDVAFDASVALTPTLPIRETDASGTVEIDIVVYSPAGDDVQMDGSDTLGIRFAPATVTASEATVQASTIAVNAAAAELDFEGIDPSIAARVQSGTLRLDIGNAFSLEGTLDLDFSFGSDAIQRSVALATGQSTVLMPFSGAELRQMLEAGSVDVVAHGALSAPGGTVTVTPADRLVMESQFELVVLMGGEGGV